MAWRIGIDIGGTFTDVAMVDEASGRIEVAKVPTTPADFGQAVIDGIRQGLTANAIAAADVALLAHATTVVTNALLEKTGRPRRLHRHARLPRPAGAAPLVARRPLRPAVRTRPTCWCRAAGASKSPSGIDAQGAVVTPLAEAEIPALIEAIRAAGLQTVAVSLPVLLPQRHARTPPRRRPAPGAARGAGVSLLRGAAGNPRIRARQHHRGLRLCRAAARAPISIGCSARRRISGCRSCT